MRSRTRPEDADHLPIIYGRVVEMPGIPPLQPDADEWTLLPQAIEYTTVPVAVECASMIC